MEILHDDDLAMQALVWLCMVQFRAIRFGTSYSNLRQPVLFKAKFKGKTFSCIQKYGIYAFFIDVSNIAFLMEYVTMCEKVLIK